VSTEQKREQGREAMARFRAKLDPSVRKQLAREASRKWRERNREKHRAYTRDYEKRNRQDCSRCGSKMRRTAKLCGQCSRKIVPTLRAKGRYVDGSGYVHVKARIGEPGAKKNGFIVEHRRVMQDAIGRGLMKCENVHHKNGNRSDNRIENLELWVTMQPTGQRPQDLLKYAHEIIARYENWKW
jgi:hypothetical protein